MRLPNIESIPRHYEHVYVSAHLDDVVLSCGGRIVTQRRAGEAVLVVTVFTGDIPEDHRPRGRGFDLFTNTEERRAEDQRAMERLGVDYLWLDYPEALFRHKRPLLLYSLQFRRTDAEATLCEALLSDVRRICRAARNKRLYLPFGVGQHVDHRIAFQLGVQMHRTGKPEFELCYYEDVPYTFIPHVLKYRMKLVGINTGVISSASDVTQRKPIVQEVVEIYKAIVGLPSVALNNLWLKAIVFLFLILSLIVISLLKPRNGALGGVKLSPEICDVSSAVKEKMAAILEYRSQCRALFPGEESLRNSLARYSQIIGGSEGQYLERYWNSN